MVDLIILGEKTATDEAKLGDLNLNIGQSFLYLFDYGAEWTFEITVVERSDMDTRDVIPKVVSYKGEAQEQYDW